MTQFNSAELEEGAVGHFEAKLEPTDDGDLTLQWTLDGKPLAESKHRNLVLKSANKILFRFTLQESSRIWDGDI